MTYDENYTNVIMFWIKIRNRIMIQRNKGRDALIFMSEYPIERWVKKLFQKSSIHKEFRTDNNLMLP